MIKFKFGEIVASRNLKKIEIAAETGVSKNTLSSLSTNSTEMIRLDTINKLCNYLNITPGDFFEYIPVEIELIFTDEKPTLKDFKIEKQYDVVIKVLLDNKPINFIGHLLWDIYPNQNEKLTSLRMSFKPEDEKNNFESFVIVSVPKSFWSQIDNEFNSKTRAFFSDVLTENAFVSVSY